MATLNYSAAQIDALLAKADTSVQPETTGDLDNLATSTKTDLVAAINETFQSVSDGKTLVAAAITDKGVATAATDSFADMATNIAAIPTGGSPNLQTKTKSYTPSESAQSETVEADAEYDGLDGVNISVGAISSSYVGSGITRRSSGDLSASGATVSVPAGYYENSASQAVASGTATPASSITASSASVSTGTNTLTLSKSVSNTPQVSAGYVSSGTAGTSSVSLTASVTTKAATTYHPSTSDQTIASGTYLTGAQTVKAVTLSNLTADNIKSGVTVKVGDSSDDDCVASVLGTYSGGGGGKAIQAYIGYDSRAGTSYGATNVKLTVAKTGTYKISWCAARGSSTGTMGTNLHIGSSSGTNQQTFTGTYWQNIVLEHQSLTANTVLTIYATSGSNSRYIYVGNLIIEEE